MKLLWKRNENLEVLTYSLWVFFCFSSDEFHGLNLFFLRFLCIIFMNCRSADTEYLQWKISKRIWSSWPPWKSFKEQLRCLCKSSLIDPQDWYNRVLLSAWHGTLHLLNIQSINSKGDFNQPWFIILYFIIKTFPSSMWTVSLCWHQQEETDRCILESEASA